MEKPTYRNCRGCNQAKEIRFKGKFCDSCRESRARATLERAKEYHKIWNKRNPEKQREYAEVSRQRKLLVPRFCVECKNQIPPERRRSGVMLCSRACLLKRRLVQVAKYRMKRRLRVFKMLGGPVCVYCGCDYIPALEINHKFGGGSREFRRGAGGNLVLKIYQGKRKPDDLEVACRVCNAWHYISKKGGVDGWKITWNQQN